MEGDGAGNGTGEMAFTGTLQTATAITNSTPGLKIVAPDPGNSSYVYYGIPGVNGKIIRATASSGIITVATCRSNINGLGGVTADSSFNGYIYWTQADGGVYRTLKTNCL